MLRPTVLYSIAVASEIPNGIQTTRRQKHARWKRSWLGRRTAVAKRWSAGVNRPVEDRLQFCDRQSDDKVSRWLGWVSNGMESLEEFYQREQYSGRRVHFRRSASWSDRQWSCGRFS